MENLKKCFTDSYSARRELSFDIYDMIYELEMGRSIGIGKYRLKFKVSVSVQTNFQVSVSVELLGIGIG